MKINSFLKFSIFLAYVGIVYSKPNEEKIVRLAASKGQHQVVIMWEKQTPRLTDSLVRDGPRHIRMTMISPTWEITTSVGIPTEPPTPKSGVTPLIQKWSHNIA